MGAVKVFETHDGNSPHPDLTDRLLSEISTDFQKCARSEVMLASRIRMIAEAMSENAVQPNVD